MLNQKKLQLLLSVLVLVVLLAFPVAAGATLAFVRNPLHPEVYIADDDGSRGHYIAHGEAPHVSPDGTTVAYLRQGPKNEQEMILAPSAGGVGRKLMVGWREPSYLEWSPDSKTILALRGSELGERRLVAIDVAGGTQSVIATGFFSGFSFSPSGLELAYAKAGSEDFPPRSDVFRTEVPIPGVVHIQAPQTYRLTSDHRSSYPLWGPQKIVFVKTVDAKKRRYGPKNELYLMNPQGKGVKRLTHTKVPALAQGLFPTDWSANGNRLLTEFEGQDISYAVKVNRVRAARSRSARPASKASSAAPFPTTASLSSASKGASIRATAATW
jgi:hypothetical protein